MFYGNDMNKIEEYKKLVDERKACRRCNHLGLTNPAEIKDEYGKPLDSDQIGPWSRWQGKLDAPLMVVGQDWGGTRYFKDNRGLDKPRNFTNLALVELIKLAGFSIQDIYLPQGQNVLFFTNAILCLKEGNLDAKVNKKWYEKCDLFLRRQIEIVNPVVVVGLGEKAYRAILKSFGMNVMKESDPLKPEVERKEGRMLPNGSRVFAVYHCSPNVQRRKQPKTGKPIRTLEEQEKDWLRIRRFLEKTA